MTNKASKKYVSVAELGKMLGISRIAVFKRIQKGQIPAEKIGHSYAISMDNVNEIIQGKSLTSLSKEKKIIIQKAVEKTVKEYGEALKLLGKE
ncbi:helix-turn-helix domain-containing protein [Candidatus Kuenenbacteria bacterium]|nr:helix-turn-helix domain-containing protein [Candidatus Kuenenbacteria bacterium]